LTACDFAELSIGHELIADALVEGFSTSVRAYRTCLSALRLRDPRRSSK
jgi:pyridoxine 5'-phosphate synthase PdxJ